MKSAVAALLLGFGILMSAGCHTMGGKHGCTDGCNSCESGACSDCGETCKSCGGGGCKACNGCGKAGGHCGQGGVCKGCGGAGCKACGGCGRHGGCGHCGLFGCGGCGPLGALCGHGAEQGPFAGPAGPPTGQVTYPYYTTRGPRDFLVNNPPSIGN